MSSVSATLFKFGLVVSDMTMLLECIRIYIEQSVIYDRIVIISICLLIDKSRNWPTEFFF